VDNELNTPTGLGAVFTRPWAVNLVLDMAGYTPDSDLAARTAVEPSCGDGAFISAMVDRLAASCTMHGRDLARTTTAIWARDLDPRAVTTSRAVAANRLQSHGVAATEAEHLAARWIEQGDFLLQDCPPADYVVGNPPYVRLKHVPSERSSAYRSRWSTMGGCADVYVGFIEAGLDALKMNGVLAVICADRWMRNQYGKRLRSKIETGFAMDAVITLHDADPFEQRVAAYPAVFTIRNAAQRDVFIADTDATFNEEGARDLASRLPSGAGPTQVVTGPGYAAVPAMPWRTNLPSWPSGTPQGLALVATLEEQHPAIGDPDCGIKVGIGLTTGADAVYLSRDRDLVETERLMPAITARDIRNGWVEWTGTHLVNPWEEDGLIELDAYPRARRYFTSHEGRLRGRHVGQRQPERWYRTIDRPISGLADTRKLLLADLRPRVSPVLEEQGLYPHHNLFWITSDTWDLQVLGGLLLADYATLFVETYSPRMAGGALRVTAQYIRRIRVPPWETVSSQTRLKLAQAFDSRDISAATQAAKDAYRIAD
jgi:methylase of polypeptide subunit release factors